VLFNWDASAAWSAFDETADRLLGPGQFDNAVQSLATNPKGPEIRLKEDVMDNLTGRLIVLEGQPQTAGKAQPARTAEPAGSAQPARPVPTARPAATPATLFAAGLKDQGTMQAILKRIAERRGSDAGSRQVDDRLVYIYQRSKDRIVNVTVANGFLMICDHPQLLDQAIRKRKEFEALARSAEFQRHVARVPQQTSILGFQKSATQVGTVYNLLKQTPFAGSSGVDTSLLPPFEKVQHYFLPTMTWAAPIADGFQYVSFSLRPAGETGQDTK